MSAWDEAWERYRADERPLDEYDEDVVVEQERLLDALWEAETDLELADCVVCGEICVPDPGAMGRAPVCACCSGRERREHDDVTRWMALGGE